MDTKLDELIKRSARANCHEVIGQVEDILDVLGQTYFGMNTERTYGERGLLLRLIRPTSSFVDVYEVIHNGKLVFRMEDGWFETVTNYVPGEWLVKLGEMCDKVMKEKYSELPVININSEFLLSFW